MIEEYDYNDYYYNDYYYYDDDDDDDDVLSPHWSRCDVQCDLWPWQRNQKRKKKRQTGYSSRPPTSP